MDRLLVLCLGSNYQQEQNIALAQMHLQQALGALTYLGPAWTDPEGIDSPPYLNCIGYVQTGLSYSHLHRLTKDIERELGRTEADKQQHVVKIDIDILQLGDDIYHRNDWDKSYVQQLIKGVLSTPE